MYIRPWSWLGVLAVAVGLLAEARPASAQTTISGGSDLLSAGQANQLGAWLGEGPNTISRIFTKTTGMSSTDFHAAADGRGRTFTVIEVTGSEGTRLIGGYNPQSWASAGGYYLTPGDAQRTGFLFNLTQGFKQDQKKIGDNTGSESGLYQTYNDSTYGPTFGGGHDIYVSDSLNGGYAVRTSYGLGGGTSGQNIYGTTGSSGLTMGRIEVFTIGPTESASAVPEPGSLLLFLPALGGLALLKRRRSA